MNTRVVVPMVVAVVAGLAAIVLIRSMMDKMAGPPADVKPVLVARESIKTGTELKPEMLAVVNWPAGVVTDKMISNKEDLTNRISRVVIPELFPISEDFLYPKGFKVGPDLDIPAGYQAFVIKDELTTASGMILPGSRVDVVAEIKNPKTNVATSRHVLQNVQVLKVGPYYSREDMLADSTGWKAKDLSLVTLLLKPEEVAIAHESSGKSRLTFSVRSASDNNYYEYGSESAPAAPAEPKTKSDSKPTAPRKWVTWEVRDGEKRQVTYVYVNGEWVPETNNGVYGGPDSNEPQSKSATNPPVDKVPSGNQSQSNSSDNKEREGEGSGEPTESATPVESPGS